MKTAAMIGTVAVFLLAGTGSKGAPDANPSAAPPRDEDIYELLDVMGSMKLMEQVMDQLAVAFGRADPNIPKSFWAEMKKRLQKEDLYKMVAPAYRKNLSSGDVKAMLAFYKTPAGQRVIKVLPAITQETMTVGQAWGEQIARDIAAEAKKRGYKVGI
jgi:hypothetical protein